MEDISPGSSLAEEEQHCSDTTSASGNRGLLCQILGLAFPALISLCVDPLMSAVDTAYIGQLDPDLGGGKVGLGALGLNTNLFNLIIFALDFLATVPTPYVASARAKGDFHGAADLAGQFLTSALVLGVVLTLILEYYGVSILRVMGSTSLNEEAALLYLRTRALSVPAVLLMAVGNGTYRGFLDTKTPLFIALGANVINFVLDPILIFKLGLGVQGAAITTAAAEWTGALVFLLCLRLKDPAIRPRMISFFMSRERWEKGREVFTSSASSIARMVILMVVITGAGVFAAKAGSASIAAHQVAMQFWMLLSYTAHSLAVTVQGFIGDRMGADMVLEARIAASLTLLLATGWGIVLLAVFQIGGDVLPLLFTTDKEVLAAIAQIMGAVSAVQFINMYVYTGEGILVGSKDFVYEVFAMTLSASIWAVYMIVSVSHKAEITLPDVWIGLLILQLFAEYGEPILLSVSGS